MVLLFELFLLLILVDTEFMVKGIVFALQNVDLMSRGVILVLVLFNLIFL